MGVSENRLYTYNQVQLPYVMLKSSKKTWSSIITKQHVMVSCFFIAKFWQAIFHGFMFFHCKILTRYDQYIYIYGILWMNNGIIRYGIILYGIILWDYYIYIYGILTHYIYTIPQNPIESRRPPHLSAVAAALNGIHQGPSRWWPRRSRWSFAVKHTAFFNGIYMIYTYIYI